MGKPPDSVQVIFPVVFFLCVVKRQLQRREVHGAVGRGVLPLSGFLVAVAAGSNRNTPEITWTMFGLNAIEPDRDAQSILEGADLLLGTARRGCLPLRFRC